jgi:hypothetical protein
MAERFFKNSVKSVATDAQAEIHFISMYPDSIEWIEVYGRLLSSNWEEPAALDPAPPYAARARQAAHPPSYQDLARASTSFVYIMNMLATLIWRAVLLT